MPGDDAFKVEGRVTETCPNGTYRVALKNGHCLTAFIAGKTKKKTAGIKAGSSVKLQLTPYDLSVGRILVETKDLK
jgi:translation initiation factor IF-1